MNTYKIEITDTFSEEANFSWIKRYTIKANSVLGAIRKASRLTGYRFKINYVNMDCARYDAKNACVCAFITSEF